MSWIQSTLQRLVEFGPAAHTILDGVLDELPLHELGALDCDWPGTWARAKQVPPATDWRSWGFLAARGIGKTRAIAEFVNGEAESGRAMQIGLCAQNEDKCIAIQVEGASGLIATAPPWFKPRFEVTSKQLVWPNGARAYVLSPEAPGNIRGLDYHLSWLTEVQSYPTATRDEAILNFGFATRLGYGRTVWDATPKRRHPILKKWLVRSESEPQKHIIVRGTIHENAANLSDGVIEDLEKQYGGTQKGREELLGEWLEDSEAALVKAEWIDSARRNAPDSYVRKAIGIDPAVTNRAGNDRTGIVQVGLGVDGQVYVIRDDSGRYDPSAWAAIVVDSYLRNGVDLVVVETNKGGALVTQNLRALAPSRGLAVVVVGADERPQRRPGTLFVKEVHARGAKEDRAQPLATAYERGRVSHVHGANLSELEDVLTTWEPKPGSRSPDALDALVHGVVELLGLAENTIDPRAGFTGINDLHRLVTLPPARAAIEPALTNSRSIAFTDSLERALWSGGRDGKI